MSREVVFALALLTPFSCVSDAKPPQPPPAPDVADGCELACHNLERLDCPNRNSRGPDDIGGTLDDVPCARACRDVESAGIARMNTSCVASAKTCSAASDCN